MVKDHSDSERGRFLISNKGFITCTTPADRTVHTTAFVYTGWNEKYQKELTKG